MTQRPPRKLRSLYFYSSFAAVCLVALIFATTNISSSQSLPAAKIAPRVLAETADGNSSSVVILLADQADVSAAYDMKDQDARGWFVYNTLTQHAARTQADLQEFLKAQGVSYQSFWAANMIVANADRPLVEALAARSDVARVDSNQSARWIEEPEIAKLREASNKPDAPNTAELGVVSVNAPGVWALGFTGQGIVVGGLDTGIRWTHNALKPKYRGWNGVTADHNYNWHDAIHSGGGSCGANSIVPCDDTFHGSHTVGTMVGDDGAGNQIGVAPGAKWIGCRNMDQGNGTPATYTECFQFTIAPTDLAGNNPNPSLRPHVLNNSWGCPISEGCTTQAELETIVNNTQASGIFVVVSNGNDGPGCSSVSNGTNAGPPAVYNASFSVGAISAGTNVLASFSSRGPSLFYSPNLLKPNISAPGVSVRSVTNASDTGYTSASGTSMAGPHVAGVVALLWSARPQLLRNISQTKIILQNTANPGVTVSPAQTCGGTTSTQIPNNSFGYGRVDALAAVNSVPTSTVGSISGKISTPDGQPLAGVTIKLSGAKSAKTITDSNGHYVFANVDTEYVYTVSPSRVNYHFSPDNRSFSLTGNNSDAAFTANPDAVIAANPLDTPEFFVRQHYLDFLGREPDDSGFNFWSDQILGCGADAVCIAGQRDNTSGAFFLSIEFQETGYFAERMYKVAYGDAQGQSTLGGNHQLAVPIVRRGEFLPDQLQLSNGVIIGQPNAQQQLEANKVAYANDFVSRSRFTTAYPDSMSNAAFVDALNTNSGNALDSGQRNNLVNQLNASTMTRAQVVRAVAEDSDLTNAEKNKAFVLMQYLGYLRRDPNSGQDTDYTGYEFWLQKLNQHGGDFHAAQMVRSFIVSGEYRDRFPR
jgi:serine protease AprX